MKTLKRFLRHTASIMLVLMCISALQAQEPQTDTPAAGGFQNNGEVTVGYRFTDIAGYRPQYEQLFNLNEGFRVLDFTLNGDARERNNRFADGYFLSASGLGGDPFATAELKVAKTNLYDFRVQWRQSYYYRNQDDDVVLPITTAASGLSKGLTDYHDWATVRKLGTASFTFHATNQLRFNVDYYRTSTDGPLLTTRSLDFFNAPTYWGAFARANPYPLNAPLHDKTNRLTGGLDYSWRNWDFHYRAGYQSFNETTGLNAVAANEVSINPATLSTLEPLAEISWSQTRELKTPVSEFSFRGNLTDQLELRGGYTYARNRGPAALDMSFSGIAPNGTAVLAPYSVSESGVASVTEPNHAVNLGFTWQVRNWWALNADYRYTRYTSEAVSTIESLFNGTTSSSGNTTVVWENGLSDLEFNMVFTPLPNLVLSPGIRLSKSDIETRENGVTDEARTQRAKHARPEFRFGYKPWSKLSFRGDLHSSTSGASYTAITPHTRVAGHLIARFELLDNLSIENALTVSTARLEETDYRNQVRANTITISYALDERFSVFGSFGYESFYAQGEIVYARGTSPLRSTLRDQEIHRVWQAGFDAKPFRYMGVRASASFDRLTGRGEIVGEPPAYGPLTWPLGTATFYFDVPRAGRFSLDLQRTYYIEEIVPANNFSANLLTIRFTRGF